MAIFFILDWVMPSSTAPNHLLGLTQIVHINGLGHGSPGHDIYTYPWLAKAHEVLRLFLLYSFFPVLVSWIPGQKRPLYTRFGYIDEEPDTTDHYAVVTNAFTRQLKNTNAVVIVRGWNEAAIRKILADFLAAYELQASAVKVKAGKNGSTKITFPNNIEPKILYFLINYFQYPKHFDFKHHSISVVGQVVLDQSFGIPDKQLIGKHAEIYVPKNDDEFDMVYAKIDSGEVYQISFTDLIWQRVNDARTPDGIAGEPT